MPQSRLIVFILFIAFFSSCQTPQKDAENSQPDKTGPSLPDKSNFQQDGSKTDLFFLEQEDKIKVAITNYGGRIVSLWVKDQNDKWTDIVLGFNSVSEFQQSAEKYYGALIGRYGNRIGGARFNLEGIEYKLPVNNGPNTLHGGPDAYHNVVWDADQVDSHTLKLSYESQDGEMGFPGNLDIEVIYKVTQDPGLEISYLATTDLPTVINLTNHAFYNLNGEGSGTINNHLLQIEADQFTPVDSTLIPTGELLSVEESPFDFRQLTPIGQRVNDANQQLAYGKGYDHNFVLKAGKTDSLHLAAVAVGDKSGIKMSIYTQEPGIQFYGGNFMSGKQTGKQGNTYGFRTAFCLETQHFPDSPNKPQFPSSVLVPGDRYQTRTLHTFSILNQ